MTKYIGDKEIKGIEKNVVTFVDDSTKEYTERQLTYLVTEEPKDLSALRNLVLEVVVPEIFMVLENHDIKYGDLDAVLQSVAGGYKVALYKAIGQRMGTYEEGKHIEYFMEDIKMSDIKKASPNNFNF